MTTKNVAFEFEGTTYDAVLRGTAEYTSEHLASVAQVLSESRGGVFVPGSPAVLRALFHSGKIDCSEAQDIARALVQSAISYGEAYKLLLKLWKSKTRGECRTTLRSEWKPEFEPYILGIDVGTSVLARGMRSRIDAGLDSPVEKQRWSLIAKTAKELRPSPSVLKSDVQVQ